MKKFIIGSINLYCGHLLPECGVWAPVIHQFREFHKVSRLIISAVTAADVWRVLKTPEQTQSVIATLFLLEECCESQAVLCLISVAVSHKVIMYVRLLVS